MKLKACSIRRSFGQRTGQLYLFPRLVARGNYSRIGIARVLFDSAGDPIGVERMGMALEPEADYELTGNGGGCEDPRMAYVEPLQHYVMTYTALSRRGPRIAIAISDDLLHWRRLGLATFHPYNGIAFDGVDDKDASIFPRLIPDPSGQPAIALVHRPLFPGTRPEEKVCQPAPAPWIFIEKAFGSRISRVSAKGDDHHLGEFVAHRRLACPEAAWERLKIGGGAPPILCRHGWLMIYHGVHDIPEPGRHRAQDVLFSRRRWCFRRSNRTGLSIARRNRCSSLKARWKCHGTVDNVVFPTGIDRRDDLGAPDRFDVYYGMADDRIGVARLDVPATLPRAVAAD